MIRLALVLLAWVTFAAPALAADKDFTAAQAAIGAALRNSKVPGIEALLPLVTHKVKPPARE
ncbi:MAG TPA: hypothetical protein VHX61_09370 [Rhizomicrobium sp.]|nr:hypothetical protein [Rhizomicrobium sp.]